VLVLALAACPKSTKLRLAKASDSIATVLQNVQAAVHLGVADGTISQAEGVAIDAQLVRAATAGLALDAAIRSNSSSATVSQDLRDFIAALNTLNTSGVAGIKNPAKQNAIAVILQGAASAVAVIASVVGA